MQPPSRKAAVTKTIARIIEARPEVDVAPLSDLLGLEYLFDIPLRSLKSSHLRDTANKIGGCCKKGTVNTSEARSVRLLLKWLSPDQREQFDDSGFSMLSVVTAEDDTGSMTG